MSDDYRQAGVDIEAGEEAVRRIKPLVRRTFGTNVLSSLGSFGGLFALDTNRWKHPVLVSSTDGVGTKLLVARMCERYDTVGRDLVNHCVDDIFVQGAHPLFFLDYIGVGKLSPERIEQIVEGMTNACIDNDTALIGGEMAEMPGIYREDDFDLVGTIVGVVEWEKVITGAKIKAGDTVLGYVSTGLHTNGFSLARKIIFERLGLKPSDLLPGTGQTIGDALLAVHKSYFPLLRDYTDRVHGMAHITGGGIPGNLKRIIPDGLVAEIDAESWTIPPLFAFLGEGGKVERTEMYRAFNMGIGFIVVASPDEAEAIAVETGGITIGRIARAQDGAKVRVR
jgi:phosphoribosylformylglycinamidine cyclo-ligase